MKRKIVGIFVMMLLIAPSISSYISSQDSKNIDESNENNANNENTNGFRYDFIDHGPEASWWSWAPSIPPVELSFNVPPDDPTWGFAGYRYDYVLEDGNTYEQVMHTHPYWADEGIVSGMYPLLTIPADTELYLTLGFVQGAGGSDGVQFQVFFLEEGEQYYIEIANINSYCDGFLDHHSLPMETYAGKTGQFILRVYAGPTSNQDWAVWAEAELRPTGEEEMLDQHQDWSDECRYIDDYEWQEFIPTMNNLIRVEVKVVQWYTGAPDLILTIEKPLGNVLTEKQLPATSLPENCNWASFDVPDIDLTPGESYYIKLTAPLGSEYGWGISWNGLYPPGESSQSPADWCFRTYAKETVNLPPTVSITNPNSGDTVNDVITITGEAHDPEGDSNLEWVQVKIDGGLWQTASGTSLWSYTWDTRTTDDGLHTISAKTFDGSLESSVSTIDFYVDNGVGPVEGADLIVTDVWNENDMICYQIRNIGNASASGGHITALYVDGEFQVSDQVNTVLSPGDRYNSCFDFDWECDWLNVSIKVTTDYENDVDESDEVNNERFEWWKCDNIAPIIISGPVAQSITQSSAVIVWRTDEECDSKVFFDDDAGEFDDNVMDDEMVCEHSVKLSGLRPGYTYQYMVESIDISSNVVRSRDYFFKTSPVSDNKKPSISMELPENLSGFVNISVDVSDNVGMDRVVFFCDDEQIYTKYSPPYECKVNTLALGEGNHDVLVRGFDGAGNIAETLTPSFVKNTGPINSTLKIFIMSPTLYSDIEKEKDDIRITAYIKSLNSNCITDYWVSINDKIVESEYDLECPFLGKIPPSGVPWDIIDTGDSRRIDFYYPSDSFSPGDIVRIRFWARDNSSNQAFNMTAVNIVEPIGFSKPRVTREVERIGNFYRVNLTIKNLGYSPINDISVEDTSIGFHCLDDVYREDDGYLCSGTVSQGQINFDLPPYITLDRGEYIKLYYKVVPILMPNMGGSRYKIGDNLEIKGNFGTANYNLLYKDLTHMHHTSKDDVSYAISDADYLIVTLSPADLRLKAGFDIVNVNKLFLYLTELAILKNGVFGFTPSNPTNSEIRDLIKGDWKDWLTLTTPDTSGNFDYLLLIGEHEIIPSWYQDYASCWELGTIELTDNPYADVSGHGEPELNIGRIIGDRASELCKPIEICLNIYKNLPSYRFDRSHAFLISGTGDGKRKFKNNIDNYYKILGNKHIIVARIHWSDHPGTELLMLQVTIRNKDIIVFRGHGSPSTWSPGLHTLNVSTLNFGETVPFVFANCCLTGHYKHGGLAEAFLKNGTAVYIGSTEGSDRDRNNEMGNWFFNRWDTHESVADTFKDLKRHFWDEFPRTRWRDHMRIYNLYGDPKFGITSTAVSEDNLNDYSIPTNLKFEEPPSFLEVVIPDYEINTQDGIDYVEIPDGEILLAEDGRPRVPYYSEYIEYSNQYKVQNVILKQKSGEFTTSDLILPYVELNESSDCQIEMKEGWYPDEDYRWRIEENNEETNTLVINMYPFYYNPQTTQVKFYKNYEFNIEYIQSDISISFLDTEKDCYKPGEIVNINIWIDNLDTKQDIVTSFVVKNYDTDEIVEGLSIRTLKDCKGICSYSATWDSHGIEKGNYYVEATISDSSGNIFDKEYLTLYILFSDMEIESVTGGFGITADIRNNGTENMTDVYWSISVEGNIVLLGGYKDGSIPILMADESKPVKSGLVLGLGDASITVYAGGVSKKASCFLFGPFVFNVKET